MTVDPSLTPAQTREPVRELIIGVDGGGSKTIALVADGTGCHMPPKGAACEPYVLGRGSAGPSNYHVVGLATATEAVETAITVAIEEAGEDQDSAVVNTICLGLAGMGRPEDRAMIQRWATERFAGARVTVVTDAQLVLAAGTPQGWGLALISGTGSLVYGEDSTGRCARAGGWGYLLGDEGSGYAIGVAALRAIARAADGRGPQTALTAAVLDAWRLSQPQDLIAFAYQVNVGRAEIASLASLVDTTACDGDAVAGEISAAAGRELALALQTVSRRLAFGEGTPGTPDDVGRGRGWSLAAPGVPCALAGSVLVHGKRVRAALLESAATVGLRLDPISLVPEPALGALLLAHRRTVQTTTGIQHHTPEEC